MSRMEQSKRRRASSKRSRTGCRTCRLRHVKCDETPGACQNCLSNGWTCDGYELNRLPARAHPVIRRAPIIHRYLTTGFGWVMTPDEKRCISFFLNRTVPNMTSFYDSWLWQNLVLQMSSSEPAVYHAVVALSAVTQDLERHGVPVPGMDSSSMWYRFALEQSVRSFSLLSKRCISQDPQLREVFLVCCLLFVLLDLVCGRLDNASVHLRSGLAILKELRIQRQITNAYASPVDDSLMDALLHLKTQAALHGDPLPVMRIDDELVYNRAYEQYYLHPFRNLADAQQAINPLINTVFPFLEQCWCLTATDILANYGVLDAKRQRLFSCVNQYGPRAAHFREAMYDKLTKKEQRGADVVHLMYLAMSLILKTCLFKRGSPQMKYFIRDHQEILSVSLEIMKGFEENPFITIDTSTCPALFVVAAQCPDYGIRWQAINALRSWPRCEGFLNSVFIGNMALEGMKIELAGLVEDGPTTRRDQFALLKYRFEGVEHSHWLSLEPDRTIFDALASVQSAPSWPCVRFLGFVPETGGEILKPTSRNEQTCEVKMQRHI
ncbi:hypothetical protein BDV59DRAFT_212020 [Aspergillus ambiguus]|uniref:Zn(II)2Cys6 transcription factor n=1 Tax=Aspergillus ambiguus TaxID=176160 RepID=UPI003CCD972F